MKAARERPGPSAHIARPAKSPSSDKARAPRRPKDSTDIGTKGRAEDTCRYARRIHYTWLQRERRKKRPASRKQN
jgi:hypothetical protein